MSMLTKATVGAYRPTGLRATAVMGLVAMTVAATALLLLHVQLRFAISDLKIQTRSLQKDKEALESRRNQLRSTLEELKSGQRILDHAKEALGMVPYDPGQAATLTLSSERRNAWRDCEPDTATPAGLGPARQVAENAIKERGVESIETILEALKTKTRRASAGRYPKGPEAQGG